MAANKTVKTISEEEIERESETKATFLVTSIFYQKGGTSWVSGRDEPRGYYLRVMIESREQRGGYTMTGFELFTGGLKSLLERADRFNAKKLESMTADREEIERIKAKVLAEREERITRRAEQRARVVAAIAPRA